jgi:cerevisin
MSTWKNNLTRLDSGTSMASPHIVGIAAYLLGLGATAELLCETIQRYATKDLVLVLPDNTPNLLAYNGASDL